MTALVASAILAISLAQSDPGTVVVVFGDPGVVTFDLPDGTPYQLDYPFGVNVYFDRALTDWALSPPSVYVAHNHGDFTGDHALDATDIPGFMSALIDGPYDSRGDFDTDGQVDLDDVAPFAEAVANGYPAEGVVLYVSPQSISETLGDRPIDLMTDPDEDQTFTPVETRPMTFIYVQSWSNQDLGTPIEFLIEPAIAPLAFDENTTAVWEGYLALSAGNTPPLTMKFDANQVRVRTPDFGELLIGDGALDGAVPLLATLGTAYATAIGRTTLNFNGYVVKTPEFQYILDVDDSFRFCTLLFDEYDPDAYEPIYGQSTSQIRIVHIWDSGDPQLNELRWYQVALEIPVVQNDETMNNSPSMIHVDVVTYDSSGQQVDTVTQVELTKVDDDGDPYSINYRSATATPLIMVDAPVNHADYPDLLVLETRDGGYMVVYGR